MFKSIFTLSAAAVVLAIVPLALGSARAASLPSIYDAHGEYEHEVANCAAETPPESSQLASGRIVAIDPSAGRVTLDYRPLPLLPEGGVRIFTMEDPDALKGLSPGDRVRFEVEREGRGYVVTRIENSN